MTTKKDCIVFYSESSRDWLDKISESINVIKQIKLDEKETIETVNEKIKNNFCIGDYYKPNNQPSKNLESSVFLNLGILFLSVPKTINIKELFLKNNFSPYLPTIIEVNEKDKLDQIISRFDNAMTAKNIKHHLLLNINSFLNIDSDKHDPGDWLWRDLIGGYLDSLKRFSKFFIQIHYNNCDAQNCCKIENIEQYYKFYYNCKDLSSEDVKDVFEKIKSIKNIFGFFQKHNENDFISNLEYLFKYNIIINAFSIMNRKKGQKLKSGDLEINDIWKIEKYYELSEEERERIRSEIVNKKFITLE